MTETVDTRFLQTDRFEQCYLPPCKGVADLFSEANLSDEAVMVINIVLAVFTVYIVQIANFFVRLANENGIKNRLQKLSRAADEVAKAKSAYEKDTEMVDLSLTVTKVIIKVRLLSYKGEYESANDAHKALDAIERNLKVLVGKIPANA